MLLTQKTSEQVIIQFGPNRANCSGLKYHLMLFLGYWLTNIGKLETTVFSGHSMKCVLRLKEFPLRAIEFSLFALEMKSFCNFEECDGIINSGKLQIIHCTTFLTHFCTQTNTH